MNFSRLPVRLTERDILRKSMVEVGPYRLPEIIEFCGWYILVPALIIAAAIWL